MLHKLLLLDIYRSKVHRLLIRYRAFITSTQQPGICSCRLAPYGDVKWSIHGELCALAQLMLYEACGCYTMDQWVPHISWNGL